MNLTVFTSRAAAALVAAVAGYASWTHIVAVALHAGERTTVANVLPLSIDGLIIVGTAAVFEDRRAGRVPRMSARWAIVVGIVATLAANVGSAQPTWTARAVAVVPPVAFLLAIEVLARSGKPRAEQSASAPEEPQVETPVSGETADSSAPRRAGARPSAADRVARAVARNPDTTPAKVAAKLGISERTVQRHWPVLADDIVSSPNGHRGDAGGAS